MATARSAGQVNGFTCGSRLLATALLLASLCTLPAECFMLFLHKSITNEAMANFSNDAISGSERQHIAEGAGDADLTEGGLPLTGAPYEPRFHFDDDFTYEDVARNYGAVAALLEANLSKRQRDPWEFGKILHPIEDFYSHSNYILLYRQYKSERGELVGSIPLLEEVMLIHSWSCDLAMIGVVRNERMIWITAAMEILVQ